jgi:hypothetical protein
MVVKAKVVVIWLECSCSKGNFFFKWGILEILEILEIIVSWLWSYSLGGKYGGLVRFTDYVEFLLRRWSRCVLLLLLQ